MLSFNQMDFLQDLDKLLKEYHIDELMVLNNDYRDPYVAIYSHGEYLGFSGYKDSEFSGIRTYQNCYKITGVEAPDSIVKVPIEEMNQLLNEC